MIYKSRPERTRSTSCRTPRTAPNFGEDKDQMVTSEVEYLEMNREHRISSIRTANSTSTRIPNVEADSNANEKQMNNSERLTGNSTTYHKVKPETEALAPINDKKLTELKNASTNISDIDDTSHSKLRLNILILGTIGSGKATLANKLSKEFIITPSDNLQRQTKISYVQSKSGNLKFLLIDTFGPFQVYDFRKLYSYENMQQELKKHMHDGINMIIFTIKYGCSSPEEIKVFNYIVHQRFAKGARELFTLVITASEGIGFAKRKNVLEKLQQATEDTKKFFSYFSKRTIFTAFPNIEEIKDDNKKFFQNKIEKSEKELAQLLEDCKNQSYLNIFPDITEKEKEKWSFLPSKEIDPNCFIS